MSSPVVPQLNTYKFEFAALCPAWVKSGVLLPNRPFTALVGYEADRFFTAYSSRTTTIIGDSDFIGKFITTPAHAAYYKMDTGARVFATGTMEWGLGLDSFGGSVLDGPVFHPDYHDPRVEVTTRNLLACLRDGGAACGE